MKLTSSIQAFVLHFGEMGSRWGINRTVGQIYALLFLSKDPLNAEEITETLGVSRSNVSMGLKELQSWRLVKSQHLPGDRRDYFSTPQDVLEIALTLVEERRKRELDPTLTLLRQTLMEPATNSGEQHAHERMQEMCELMEQVSQWSHDIQTLSPGELKRLLMLGSAVPKLLQMKDKLSLVGARSKRKQQTNDFPDESS
ncbi:ArsR family transcriptional regulator [Chromatiales bacterium (ex Bugula neritina AB1)]|nr:ArsR family transcriptional regulator [Chromatiales bacterium (ex Bugula neritina AB1)]